jgi:hypothetical protein
MDQRKARLLETQLLIELAEQQEQILRWHNRESTKIIPFKSMGYSDQWVTL